MKNKLFWLWFTLFALAWSVWELYPPTSRDLLEEFQARASQTDTNFAQIVASARQLNEKLPDNEYANLLSAIGTNSIQKYFPSIDVKAERDPNRAILNIVQRDAAGQIRLGLDLQGGTQFLLAMDTSKISPDDDKTAVLSQAIEVLRRRVDKFGVAEPVIAAVGEDRIQISMPGLSESGKESVRRQLQRPAFLEFRLVHEQSTELLNQGLPAPGHEILRMARKTQGGGETYESYLVKKKSERGLTGKHIKNAMVIRDPVSNQPQIHFTLDAEGARLFADITTESVGRFLAIVLDGELYSAPRIQEPITGGSGSISGSFELKEAFELANVLQNPLEAPVKIEEEFSVEPSLGRDSIRSGVSASIYGTLAVAVFMVGYYLLAGMVSIVAMVINIVVLLGVMCSFDTTLTVPGIAGIVLTIGMAVDANVLIYERIREELAAGKSLRGAIAAGYDRAFGTIFDSNLTTLIASVILIFMGTGPIKGFGVTLTIGVTVSMFTALVVTRLIFEWLLAGNRIQTLKMVQFVRNPHFDFLKFAKPAFAASWCLILVGIGYGLFRGHDVMGVDFAGGDRVTLSFAQRVETENLRKAVADLKVGEAIIQPRADIATGKETLEVTTEFGTGEKVVAGLKAAFPQAKFEQIGLYKAGPTVGRQIQKSALISVLLSLFGILVYVAFRYEFSFAVGAVVAVIHDVLMTLGIFFLSGRELSAPMVAAVLTIIGFSINDTIVIFDRIREDLKLGVRGTFREVINQALNQTLSRTIITSGTVFLATLSLYVFGGGVINDFAFTFLVGILTGTYSSIYIASTLVLWWHKGERPKAASQVVMETAAPARA